jgi:hypothetical protein
MVRIQSLPRRRFVGFDYRFPCAFNGPVALEVNVESRAVALEHYNKTNIHVEDTLISLRIILLTRIENFGILRSAIVTWPKFRMSSRCLRPILCLATSG